MQLYIRLASHNLEYWINEFIFFRVLRIWSILSDIMVYVYHCFKLFIPTKYGWTTKSSNIEWYIFTFSTILSLVSMLLSGSILLVLRNRNSDDVSCVYLGIRVVAYEYLKDYKYKKYKCNQLTIYLCINYQNN